MLVSGQEDNSRCDTAVCAERCLNKPLGQQSQQSDAQALALLCEAQLPAP